MPAQMQMCRWSCTVPQVSSHHALQEVVLSERQTSPGERTYNELQSCCNEHICCSQESSVIWKPTYVKQHVTCMKGAYASASCQTDTADHQWPVYVGLVLSSIALTNCMPFILSCQVMFCQKMLSTVPTALLHFTGAKAPCKQPDV